MDTPVSAESLASAYMFLGSTDKVNTELLRRLERLRSLRIEHRDLDDVITRLQMDMYVDEIQLRRLKKRKLRIKDMVAYLENQLIPDLDA